MEYYLMRKDEIITLCNFTSDGQMISYSEKFRAEELLPLQYKSEADHLKRWWRSRQTPLRQGRVEEMLRAKGFSDSSEFMIQNLGLSLIDYYWIKPLDSGLKWKDVNLFDNDFKDNILSDKWGHNVKSMSYSPNSSLQGELEKTWAIRNGKRVLIKGNHGDLSAESINELIASEVHKAQGYDNYTNYRLLKIKGKPYDYGCYSNAFTSNEVELVSAHAVITSEKKKEGESYYEHFIRVSGSHGIDEEKLRRDLEYQILTDYVLTNVDRHMDNIGILRDAETLKFIRMAPIFDTGRAFATGFVTPYTEREIDNVAVNSFEDHERDLIKLVRDPGMIDISKLPDKAMIEDLLLKDSKENKRSAVHKTRLYEKKIKRLKTLF